MATVSAQYQALGQTFQSLRTQKGHWDGEAFNPEVDRFNSPKHETMKQLGDYFGKPGTKASDILTTMGQPDELKQSLDEAATVAMMPGVQVGGGSVNTAANTTSGDQTMYFIYKWRGNHDYLWFKIDGAKEEVVASAWYTAGE